MNTHKDSDNWIREDLETAEKSWEKWNTEPTPPSQIEEEKISAPGVKIGRLSNSSVGFVVFRNDESFKETLRQKYLARFGVTERHWAWKKMLDEYVEFVKEKEL